MEKQYKVEMTITMDEETFKQSAIKSEFVGYTVDDFILESLEEAPYQVNCITVI